MRRNIRRKKLFNTIEIILLFFICLFLSILVFGPKSVKLYGHDFDIRSTVIDLSSVAVVDLKELEEKLAKFPNLDSVLFGQRKITYEEKENLKNIYPNVAFQAIVTRNLYGEYFREDSSVLDLRTIDIDEKLIYYLEPFYNLNEVVLYGKNLSMDQMVALRQKYPEINFKWDIYLNTGTHIDSTVEFLDFSNEFFNTYDELVQTLIVLPNAKKVEMGRSQFTSDELGNLRELFPTKEINWTIQLGYWTLRTDDVAFSVLITGLFSYFPLTSEDIQVLKYCTKLQALDLGHQRITDLSVIGDYLTELRVLILADNKITDITPLSKLHHLHYLELFLNDITDLTPLANLNEMVDLNICYNPHLKNIYPIMNYGMLERLWLVNIPVSDEDFNILSNNYPEVVISRYGYGSTGGIWRTHQRYFDMIDMYHNNYIAPSFTMYDDK